MGIIKILPEDVVLKIAAGEVVERPASVVKELLDNAVDAEATSIEVSAVEGGKKTIIVIDNGRGMDASDARRCVERHATSKIATEADLVCVRTMGFRGEALAAIAAVSRLEIETKPAGTSLVEGTFVGVQGGIVKEVRAAGCPAGTRIIVNDLFYNVPARKKFLKSDSVEYGHIADVVSSMAMAHIGVRFELSNNKEMRIRCHRTGRAKDRIEDVFGADVGRQVFEFGEESDGIELHAFVAGRGILRSTARDIHFFVNGRPVKDRILQHALLSGFETFLPRGAYPIAVLYLTINPSVVDVNVHPTKREVRFANGGMIHDFVAASVRKALAGKIARDFITAASEGGTAIPVYMTAQNVELNPSLPPFDKGGMGGFCEPSSLRVLGQLDRAFVICEGKKGDLLIIDQHAAHEKLAFEELKKQYSSGNMQKQQLLIPETVELNAKSTAYLIENMDVISKAGFEVEPFGGSDFVVKAVPALLGETNLKQLFEKIAYELEEYGKTSSIEERLDHIFALVACHKQVRAGDFLSGQELSALVQDVEREEITNCPHGRPAIIRFDRNTIEKWFARK